MAGSLGGDATGVAFDLLMKVVLDVAMTVVSFRSELDHLITTLISIKPFVKDIEKLNGLLDYRKEGAEMLSKLFKQGEVLVRNCLKIDPWNLIKKYSYAKKLEEFESSLSWFFKINVQAELARDFKSVAVAVNVLQEKMDEIISIQDKNRNVNSKGFAGWSGVPGVPDFVVGLDVQLQELKALLLKDGVPIVVLSAPGGSGKTTLAKLLCNDDEIKGKYGNNIFFQIVSRSPNLQLMVQKVFQSNKNQQVPIFQSDEDAIYQLQFFLRQIGPAPMLLVLDDMWSGSESLIEQFLLPIRGYKILVTSRFVFPRFEWTYKLNILNHQDAMTLFHHYAFKDGVCTVQKDLVEEVVRGCSGSPLALTVVGRSLYRQPTDNWIRTVQNWSQGQSIYDTNMVLLSRLKTSLDALDGMAVLKNCFLDLGLFPEDQRIPVAALMDMWAELYNLDENGMYTLVYLHELSNRNLVDLTLVRFVPSFSSLKDYATLEKVCSSAWVCGLIHLKKINLRYCQELVTLPAELGNLTNLDVLRLQSCTQLLELPESISGLRELRFLDLSDCVEMDHLPERLGDLCGLRRIRMMGCTALSELPPSVMGLVQLERVICDDETAYLWDSCLKIFVSTGDYSSLKLNNESQTALRAEEGKLPILKTFEQQSTILHNIAIDN